MVPLFGDLRVWAILLGAMLLLFVASVIFRGIR